MKSIICSMAVCCALVTGCAQESADELFRQGERATHDVEDYRKAITHLTRFIEVFPEDARADVALQALARVHQAQGDGTKAIETYQSLIDWFPKSRYVDQAQFMIGYIHDLAGRKDSAVKAYQMVIDHYPNSVLVDDATISVQNINKPLEAWIDSVTS
jgi:outer membrane protein assembly factor BamD (BamD/ComL family)